MYIYTQVHTQKAQDLSDKVQVFFHTNSAESIPTHTRTHACTPTNAHTHTHTLSLHAHPHPHAHSNTHRKLKTGSTK